MSVQSGGCANPSEHGASLPQDSVKAQNLPELQIMPPVADSVPVEPKASQESTDKQGPAAPVQVTGPAATPAVDIMSGTLRRPTPTEDNYKPEVVELCLAELDRSMDVQFVMKSLCPGATAYGARVLAKMLVALILNGESGTHAVNKANTTGFPCTTMIEILKMEAAHPDLIGMFGYSHREAADDQLRSKFQKLLQSNPSKNAESLIRMLRDHSSRMNGAAKDYEIGAVDVQRTEERLLKLKEMVAEVRNSQTQIEQIKLESILREKESDVVACKQKFKRFRQVLIDLAGINAVTQFDQSLSPEIKHVIKALQ
ncbi:MAG: hypothetical protein JST89_15675 [Cyanobacteria bacterium SZAS-4]|nr:hypothetical protein [Cyanobacteria bacterium SZAS-4]